LVHWIYDEQQNQFWLFVKTVIHPHPGVLMIRNTSIDNAISIGPVAESLRAVTDSEFDDFLQLARAITGTSAACLTFKEYDRLQLKAAKGLPQGFEDAADLYAAVMQERGMLVVSDLSKDQRFCKHSLVTREPRFLFYMGMRLDSSDGQTLGVLSIMDTVPRQLNEEQTQSLQALVRQIVRRLELSSGLDSFDWASKLLENCPAAIFCADYQARKGTIVEWNAAAEKLWDLKNWGARGFQAAFSL
jgi:PAS domain-containing protein